MLEREKELLKAEKEARMILEEGRRRLMFLADASGALTTSLRSQKTTLAGIPSLAVPEIADICVTYTFGRGGVAADTVIAARDQELHDLVTEYHDHYGVPEGTRHPLARLLSRGVPLLLSDLHGPNLLLLAQEERQREILKKLSLVSYIAAPLVASGRIIGAMTFMSVDPEKRFGEAELAVAVVLAHRAAVALDNARLFEESQRAQEELRAAATAKDEFLGLLSHELRSPITQIMSGVGILRSRHEQLGAEDRKSVLADIDAECHRMYRMVENLLALGRLELGQEVATEPVVTRIVVEKIAASFMKQKPGRVVKVETGDHLEPAAASPYYLELVIGNLLSNADKYSPPELPIEIHARQCGDSLEIAVLDRGPGVDPGEVEAIFDRFYRSDSTAGKAAGVGLGLTVCKRLIEAQSGRVWARPREGGGLEVGVSLPVYGNGDE